ncbi:MAG TPA: oligopeptide/dipeptide ABC transporter ATP-binding protein [Acidimicrobiia bacterium]|nr:oligopeptide/dipeptide ABC transporter ATP-binding protein [Acidimicrobiia bacterium]
MTSTAQLDIHTRLEPGEELLRVEDLSVEFPIRSTILRRPLGSVKAVAGISFELRAGETLGLVGESGCGKSTTGLAVLRLSEATGGSIVFRGHDLSKLNSSELRPFRREMQIVLQDPYSSLDPRLTVRSIISEPIRVHGMAEGKRLRERVDELLEMVGLRPEHGSRFPHEFSGGQRQRIGIARALALGPQLLVLDEPVSALDVSIQAQIVNLLEKLQDELKLAYLFIAHDLSIVDHISDRIAVMYLGKIVEVGTTDEVKNHPRHPYTKALLSAVPIPDPTRRGLGGRIVLEGDVPSPADPPSGCRFRTRCWKAQEICAQVEPVLDGDGEHGAACHFPEAM